MENTNNLNLMLLVTVIIVGVIMWEWVVILLYGLFLISFVAIPFSFMLRANRALKKYDNE